MKMRLEYAPSCIAIGVVVGGLWFSINDQESGSSAGQASGVDLHPHLPPPAVGLTPPEDDSEAGARFFTQPETDAAQGDPARAKLIGDETKSRAGFYAEFDEETMAPSADALFARYSALWSDKEFLALTERDLKLMLGDWYWRLYDKSPWTYPLGDLPTLADCDAAMRSPELVGAFSRALTLEMDLFDVSTLPRECRGAGYASCVKAAEDNWRAAEIDLMRELDRVTQYRHWELLWRAWEQWQK